MAEKKEKALEDTLIKWLFDTRYFPDRLLDERLYKGARNNIPYDDDDVFGIFEDGGLPKSYKEARNKVLTRVMNDKNYDVLQPALEAYNDIYNNGNPQESKFSSIENLRREPLNSEEMDPEEVVRLSGILANVVSPSENAKTFLEKTFENKERTPEMTLDNYKSILGRKALEEIMSTDEGLHRLYSAFDIPEDTDEEYVADYLSSIAGRAYDIGSNSLRPEWGKVAGEFISPYNEKKSALGKKPNAADVIGDIAQWGGAGSISALNKPTKLGGKILVGAGAGAGIDYLHDIFDSAMTKRTFANEGQENEISERGDVLEAVKQFPEVIKKAVLNNLSLELMLGTSRGIGRLAKTKPVQKFKTKVANSIDRILGRDKPSIDKKISQLKEKNDILVEAWANDAKMPKNVEKDIQERISKNRNAIEGLQKKKSARNAMDIISDVLVTKLAEDEKARNTLNFLYNMNFTGNPSANP